MAQSYRALIKRTGGPSGGTLLNLIREDAEASLLSRVEERRRDLIAGEH